MVFITRLENGKTVNEGICVICAKEIGIKPVSDMLERMGVDEGDMDAMLTGLEGNLPDIFEGNDDLTEGKIPTLNLSELFGMMPKGKRGEPKRGKGDGEKPEDEK